MPADSGFWLALADVILIVHAAFVLFVVGGQLMILLGWLLEWRWTRHLVFRLLHLLAMGFVMLEAWLDATCPLTSLENLMRAHAGGAGYERNFVSYWVGRLIFYGAPNWIFTVIYTVFTALVILTWVAYPPRRSRRRYPSASK